eukprot:m.478078 g.478078  ORF g.478078 m.478078 type:complete len:66 (+) comp21027_c0_seq1:1540-1737(+)
MREDVDEVDVGQAEQHMLHADEPQQHASRLRPQAPTMLATEPILASRNGTTLLKKREKSSANDSP